MMKDESATDKLGPTSCALGPNAVETLNAQHLCENHETFVSATIYFPKTSNQSQLLPSIVIVGGWGCGEKVMKAWAPFFASHGIVAMTIGTPTPWFDKAEHRCQALIDASKALQSEINRSDSPLKDRLDVSARAVMGYSMGGGAAQLAALRDPTLTCSIACCPDDCSDFGEKFPEELSTNVPILTLCSQKDKESPPKKQAWPLYHKITGPKLIMEISGGDHYTACGPAGGTEDEVDEGMGPFMLCNFLTAIICCGFAPFPFGTLNGPTGFAKESAPRGAIGGVALAWLQLFLLGDETAKSKLVARPDIASGYESQSI